jgi:transposase-like protein
MIMTVVACPICSRAESVVKHGTNRGGTARCRCLECRKTFTPSPNPRRVSSETEEAIARCLDERMAWSAIQRTLRVSWATIERVAQKKTQT